MRLLFPNFSGAGRKNVDVGAAIGRPGSMKKRRKNGRPMAALQVLWKICNISRISVRQALLTFPEP